MKQKFKLIVLAFSSKKIIPHPSEHVKADHRRPASIEMTFRWWSDSGLKLNAGFDIQRSNK